MSLVLTYSFIFFIGLLLGNFATTAFYRIPRSIILHGFIPEKSRPPHCSFCGHELKWNEYLPLVSIFSTWFRCNYCREKIPFTYAFIEYSAALLAPICFYWAEGNFDRFFLVFIFLVSILMSFMLYISHRKVYDILFYSMVIEGAIYRTLMDGTIIYFLMSLSAVSICSMLFLRMAGFDLEQRKNFVKPFIVIAAWVDLNAFTSLLNKL